MQNTYNYLFTGNLYSLLKFNNEFQCIFGLIVYYTNVYVYNASSERVFVTVIIWLSVVLRVNDDNKFNVSNIKKSLHHLVHHMNTY